MADTNIEIIARMTLDTWRKNNIPPLFVPQGDYKARYIHAIITNFGKNVIVKSTSAVSIVATRKFDGLSEAFKGEVNEDGSVLVPVTQWMLEYPLDVYCNVDVTGPDQKFSTNQFIIEPQKKANPTQISDDNPQKDLLTELIANENVRKAAEEERVANEEARIAAETARATAEAQRITDEQTRIDNETARVEAEATRESKFNSWEADIASLPSFDARISANSKRISNIEAGLPADRWAVDSTVAYQKDVPENALPYAAVSKIGGMTRKCTNLLNIVAFANNNIEAVINSDGTVTMTNNAASVATALKVYTGKLPAGTYTMHNEEGSTVYWQTNASDYNNKVAKGATKTFTYDGTSYLRILLEDFTANEVRICKIMLNEGTTALPYEAYFDGLRDAPVTEIKSVGKNFYVADDYSRTANGVTVLSEAETGLVKISGTRIQGGMIFNISKPNMTIAAGTYMVSLQMIGGSIDNVDGLFDSLYFGINSNTYLLRTTGAVLSVGDLGSRKITFTEPTEISTFDITVGYRGTGTIFNDVVLQCQFEKGDTVTSFQKGVEHTLPIPATVQALDGYGQGIDGTEYYNSIVWNEAEEGMKYRRLCAKRAYEDGDENLENVLTDGSSETVYVLDEPEVTDISDLLPADNLIEVEGGGTLTFVNEYGYDVPSTVTYQLDPNAETAEEVSA